VWLLVKYGNQGEAEDRCLARRDSCSPFVIPDFAIDLADYLVLCVSKRLIELLAGGRAMVANTISDQSPSDRTVLVRFLRDDLRVAVAAVWNGICDAVSAVIPAPNKAVKYVVSVAPPVERCRTPKGADK
jgi:hypothetical protein